MRVFPHALQAVSYAMISELFQRSVSVVYFREKWGREGWAASTAEAPQLPLSRFQLKSQLSSSGEIGRQSEMIGQNLEAARPGGRPHELVHGVVGQKDGKQCVLRVKT